MTDDILDAYYADNIGDSDWTPDALFFACDSWEAMQAEEPYGDRDCWYIIDRNLNGAKWHPDSETFDGEPVAARPMPLDEWEAKVLRGSNSVDIGRSFVLPVGLDREQYIKVRNALILWAINTQPATASN